MRFSFSTALALGAGLGAFGLTFTAAAQVPPPVPAPPRAAVFGAAASPPAQVPANSEMKHPRPETASNPPPEAPAAVAATPVAAPAAAAPPAAGSASDATDAPESTTATYGAWTLRCVRLPASPGDTAARATGGGERCELEQPIVQGGRTIAQIAIGADPDNGEMRIVAQLPDGSWLPAQPFLSFGGGQPVTLTYKRCLRGTCLADASFTESLELAMKSATGPGLISFQMVAGKDIALPVSVDGFAAAEVALLQR